MISILFIIQRFFIVKVLFVLLKINNNILIGILEADLNAFKAYLTLFTLLYKFITKIKNLITANF